MPSLPPTKTFLTFSSTPKHGILVFFWYFGRDNVKVLTYFLGQKSFDLKYNSMSSLSISSTIYIEAAFDIRGATCISDAVFNYSQSLCGVILNIFIDISTTAVHCCICKGQSCGKGKNMQRFVSSFFLFSAKSTTC